MVLPVTTAIVERSFSDIKTRLRNRLGEDTLDQAMRISIEEPEKISSDSLDNSYSTALERTKKAQTNIIFYNYHSV